MCFDLANSPDYDAENLSESGVASANCLIEGSGSIVYCCPRFCVCFFVLFLTLFRYTYLVFIISLRKGEPFSLV